MDYQPESWKIAIIEILHFIQDILINPKFHGKYNLPTR